MSAVGVGYVEGTWRVTLSASVLNALQLRKKDKLFLYFDYSHQSEGAGARLVGLSYPVTTSCYQGETRGSQQELLDVIQKLSHIGKFEELFMRPGRTKEYSLNYVISIRRPDDERALEEALNSSGKLIFNQRLISFGEAGKIGEACFQPLVDKVPFVVTIDAKNRIVIPASLDEFIVTKLNLNSAKRSIQTADPSTGRLIMTFTSNEELIDLTFLISELGRDDLVDLLNSLNSLLLVPMALVKRATSSPVKCRARIVLDYAHTKLGCLPEATSEALNQELKPSINEAVHAIQEKRGEEPRDVVIDIELSIPIHDEELKQ